MADEARHLQVVIELVDRVSKQLANVQKSLQKVPEEVRTSVEIDDAASSALGEIGATAEEVSAGLDELQSEAEAASVALSDVSVEGGGAAGAMGAVSSAGSRLRETISSWGEAISAQISRLGALGDALSKFETEIVAANLAMTGFAAVCLNGAIDEEKFRVELDRLLGVDAAKPIHEWIDAASQLSYTNKGARTELAATLTYMGLSSDQVMAFGDNLERLVVTFPSVGRSALDVARMMKEAVASGDPAAWERLNRVLGDYKISQEDIEREYYRLISQEKDLSDVRLEELKQVAAVNVLNAAMEKRLADVKAQATSTSDRIRELKNRLEDLSGDIGAVLIPGLLVLVGALQGLIRIIQAIPYGEQIIGIGVALGIVTTASALLFVELYNLYSKLMEIEGISKMVTGSLSWIRNAAISAGNAFTALASRALVAFRTLASGAVSAIRSIYASLGPVGIALMALGVIIALIITHWEEFQALAERLGLAGALEAVVDAGKRLLDWISGAVDRFGGWKNVLLALLGPLGLLVALITKLTGVKLPELKMPEIKLPELRIPEVRMPALKSLAFKLPGAGIVSALPGIASRIKIELPSDLRSLLHTVLSKVSMLVSPITAMAGMFASVMTFLVNLRDMFLSRMFQNLSERARTFLDSILGAFGWVGSKLTELGSGISEDLKPLATSLLNIEDWLGLINTNIRNGFKEKPESIVKRQQQLLQEQGITPEAAQQMTQPNLLPPVGQTSIQVPGTAPTYKLTPEDKAKLEAQGVKFPAGQVGAMVERTGLALVHAGEEIVPADLVKRVGEVRSLLEKPNIEPAPTRTETAPASVVNIHMPIDIRVETRKEIDPYRLRIEIEDLIRRTFRHYQT